MREFELVINVVDMGSRLQAELKPANGQIDERVLRFPGIA